MKGGDGFHEAVTFDESHGVERPAIGVVPQAIDRDDAGVFELAGDLRLLDEPSAAVGVVGAAILDLLESDGSVEFLIQGDGDLPRPPLAWGRRMRKRVPAEVELPTEGGGTVR